MADERDDLGDARSRAENDRFREMARRQQSTNPEYAYAPRWAPLGNWHLSVGNVIVIAFGLAIILMVLGMWLFGIIG